MLATLNFFHVNQALKKWQRASNSTDYEIGIEEEEDPNQLWEVEDVLEHLREGDAQEVLVCWKNYSSEFDSWIDFKAEKPQS